MDYKDALNKAKKICSKQEKCCYDIILKLREWKVNEKNFNLVTNQLIKENYIDEERYVRAFINDKFKLNKWGKIKIKYHLAQKKIDANIIDTVLNEIDMEDYITILHEIIKNKYKSIHKGNQFQIRQKLISFAYNRGFSFEESNKIIDKIMA